MTKRNVPAGIVTLKHQTGPRRVEGGTVRELTPDQRGMSLNVPMGLIRDNPQLVVGEWYTCEVVGKDLIYRHVPWDTENSALIQD